MTINLQTPSRIELRQGNNSFTYKSSLGRKKSLDPILHYKLNDDASNTTITDSIGTYNGTSQRNTSLMSATGKINNGLEFNGVVGGQLVSHWKLNGDATDSEGSNDGTTNATFVNGKINNGLEFDKTQNEYMRITGFSSPQNFSICFWIKLNSLNPTENNDYQIVMNVDGETRPVIIEQNGVVCLRIPGVDESYWVSNGNIEVGTWAHIVCTYDQDKRKIYINGQFDKEDSVGSGTVVFDDFDIGRDYGDTEVYPTELNRLDGILDEVRIYSRALEVDEAESLYNDGNGTEDTEDYINMGSDIDIDANNHSIAWWYKSSNSKFQMLFQKGLFDTCGNIEFRPSDNKICVESYTNNYWSKEFSADYFLDETIDIDDGNWHHYALVFGKRTYLYVDGKLADDDTENDDTGNNGNFRYRYIGGQGNNTWTYGQTPDGVFDDIRIYDRTISLTEIEEIYNSDSGTESDQVDETIKYTYSEESRKTLKNPNSRITIREEN